ncbi:hypothetical protein SAMN03159343_1083 [Klenkia marina]|uniref:Uncharacterized protein n=1 Tax=Klenkia marina TaxID=1960309 RepID=A0A1G4XIM9_9ACTN|nr:hypothetical protein [Klenkia marina]SCX41046.1 hypothetical protein SAMN03159343_1083 [Klenkia marina]
MRTRRLTATLAAFGTAAVVLAGCSSSPEKGDDAAAEQESPLSEYLSAVWGGDLSPEEQQAQYDEQNRQIEETVADCMVEQGFEYVPNTSNGGSISTSEDVVWEPDDREWVEQWGYGAVDNPYNDQPTSEEDEYVDPNADYVESLSESEQTAYYEALNGPQASEEDQAAMEDGTYEYDWTKSGCYGAAQHEVYEEGDPTQSEEFKPLMDAMNQLWEQTTSDPAMVELDAAWSACMEAAGHGGFATQSEAQNSIYDEQNKLYEDAAPAEGEEYVEPDQAAMDALGEKEVELALADLDCREETDYRQQAQDIQFALEEQFIADHKSELEALKAAAEQD